MSSTKKKDGRKEVNVKLDTRVSHNSSFSLSLSAPRGGILIPL